MFSKCVFNHFRHNNRQNGFYGVRLIFTENVLCKRSLYLVFYYTLFYVTIVCSCKRPQTIEILPWNIKKKMKYYKDMTTKQIRTYLLIVIFYDFSEV